MTPRRKSLAQAHADLAESAAALWWLVALHLCVPVLRVLVRVLRKLRLAP